MGEWDAQKILCRFAERHWRLSGAERVALTDQPGQRIAVEVFAENGRLLHETEISPKTMIEALAEHAAGLVKEAAGERSMA